jgi:nucleotide-binding universal stress UspA family protein
VHGTAEVVAWMHEQQKAEEAQAQQACARIAEMFAGANTTVEVLTSEGHPGKEIIRLAKERAADLIVLGAEGHSVVERMLLGSVSDFVATHADCSVLVVRPTGLEDTQHRELSVCVAYDGSDPARHALAEIRAFGWQHHAAFNVVSVLEYPAMQMDIPMTIDLEPIRAAMQGSAEEAVANLQQISSQVHSIVIEGSHVGDSIVRYAADKNSDLIVVGHTGMGLVGQFLLGGVSRYVLRHASCSVWISRQQ